MSKKITIIGAGPGGYVAAVRAAQSGSEVTLIEKYNVGGTCLNYGCIPSKIFKKSADLLGSINKASEFGLKLGEKATPDMESLQTRKTNIINSQTKGIEGLLKHHKINHIKGTAHIKGPNEVTVELPDGGSTLINWDKLIIATGTTPLNVPVFPFDGEKIISSDHLLDMTEIPESIVIIGGGVIGCEFAFILSALGSKVTVVEAMSRVLPLPSVDIDCSSILQREMKKRKIKFHVDRVVETINMEGSKVKAVTIPSPLAEKIKEKDKAPLEIEADKILVCIGRSPVNDIGLSNIGVETDEKGWINVNEKMETNVDGVYAIGDITGPSKVMLAHVASTEAEVAVDNATGKSRKMKYDVIPGAVFTMPEIGNVGHTEETAKDSGLDIRSDAILFRTLGKAQVLGEIAGQLKIISEIKTGKIVGVHIIGPQATDLLGEGTLAVQKGVTVKELAETIHAHPTLSEAMLEASFKALDMSLHG
ncbi:MAG: dihydrolipoyl dehydrogenase [Deltaproteobacteria bacterium]|nr:dihydrolipoyl dehydrogenase [Deltaproteobacteria bacterium]